MKILAEPNGDIPWLSRLARAVRRRSFWVLTAILLLIGVVHYGSPQVRYLPLLPAPLSRHAVERIMFLLPVAGAGFAFGQAGGLVMLVVVILVMLPRALFISPYPVDSCIEIVAVAIVGYFIVWMIETQEREKGLRQQIASRLKALNEVIAVATSSLELSEVLSRALDKLLEVTKLPAGALHLLDERGRVFILTTHQGLPPRLVWELGACRDGAGLIERAGRTGEVVQEPCSPGSPFAREGFSSLVAVPLKSGGREIGVLTLADTKYRPLTPQEVELLRSIGSHIGVAVENARLHQNISRQLQIEQRLHEISLEISSELELDHVLPKVLRIAVEMVGADGGVIALFDRDRQLIGYPYLHNLPAELAQVVVPLSKGLAGDVISSCQPVVVEDYRRYARAIPEFLEAGIVGAMAVPIMSGEECFGALAVFSMDEVKGFTERDVALLTGIGRQTGIVIENARLYESLRYYIQRITQAQEEERKRIARELHDETIQMLIVISRRLELLATLPEPLPEAALRHLEALQRVVSETLSGIRRFVQDLRPPALDHLGLVATLEGLAADLRERDGIETSLIVKGDAQRLTPETELMLFRVIQEALSNVRRHARASHVTLELEFQPDRLRAIVEDDGRGFNAPEKISDLVSSDRLGLVGMYERVRAIGGTLAIHSEVGRGTSVIIEVPLKTKGA
ncbi:MAG: GAF domain-containing sensor histidine kinase [Anaerolineae bacterium]|nr:GAF domain-containing sensor histidine kinase [Anaerolineae bacterium]